MTSILLVDDHPVVRRGLRTLLDAEPDFSVVGEVADGLQVVESTMALKPDVLILDLMLPGLNGLEITQRLKKVSPATRVLILSMHSNEAYVLQALRNGATGYVLKDSSYDDLILAVREVAAGREYLSPPLSARNLRIYAEKAAPSGRDSYEKLTSREREVFHLVAEGHTSGEIAERLAISQRTVEVHRSNVAGKLGVRSQTELIRYAMRRGIIPMQ